MLLSPEDKLNTRLAQLRDTLNQYAPDVGKKRLDLFFSPEIDMPGAWRTTKMVVSEGKNGEIFFKRKMFLDNPDKELGLDESYMAYMPEYDSRAYADAELFDIECTVRRFKGRSIIQIRTIAPAKYILNTSGDDRVTDFSSVHDPSFEKLVSAGIVVETVFISPMDKKVARWIVAYMDMEPEEKGQRVMGNDILSFDIRDLMPDRHTRKVERKPDGSLIVSDGRLINQREFVWDAVRIEDPAKA